MSFTRLVAYSVLPVLAMLTTPVLWGDVLMVVPLAGFIGEAFILARFLDRQKPPRP